MRQGLVICSFGDRHQLGSWLAEHRSFDVALCYYGQSDSPAERERCEYFARNQAFKFSNFQELVDRYPTILEYEYVLFIDDDVVTNARDIETIFEYARSKNLDLCQPACSRESSVSWEHLKQQPGLFVEPCDFIEIMCFCVSRRFLRRTLPYFYMVATGYGLSRWTDCFAHSPLS